MLAGILIRFGMDLFTAMQSQLFLVALMFAAFLFGRLFTPRYAVALAFAVGIAAAGALHLLHMDSVTWRSEEHTSELQSLMRISYAVFCLKKKNKQTKKHRNSE